MIGIMAFHFEIPEFDFSHHRSYSVLGGAQPTKIPFLNITAFDVLVSKLEF